MDISKLQLFDRVKINDYSGEWGGRVGIVNMIRDGVIYLITVQNPLYHYEVGVWNANNIELFN